MAWTFSTGETRLVACTELFRMRASAKECRAAGKVRGDDYLPGLGPDDFLLPVVTLTARSDPDARDAPLTFLFTRSYVRLRDNLTYVQSSKNRKSGLYVAMDVLDEFTRYERSLATVSGDTRSERPKRNVPQRV